MHHRTALTTLLVLSLALCPIHVSNAESAGDQTWQMATKGANIQEFVAQVARITGKTFIVDPKLFIRDIRISLHQIEPNTLASFFKQIGKQQNNFY